MVAAITVMAVVLAATVGLIWWRWSHEAWRPLLPGIGVTAFGLVLFAAVYLWVSETGSSCAGREAFACQMNANQGVLTLLGLFLAAAALWTTAITRYLDRRRSARTFASSVEVALLAAMEEVKHNLVHVALAYDRDTTLGGFPVLAVSATEALLGQPLRSGVHAGVLHSAEQIVRNHTALRLLIEGSATDQTAEEGGPEPFVLQAIVKQSLGLLLWGGRSTEAGHRFLHQPGLHDLHRFALADESPHICYRTSEREFKAELPTLRTQQREVLCWWNDDPPERLHVSAQGPSSKTCRSLTRPIDSVSHLPDPGSFRG